MRENLPIYRIVNGKRARIFEPDPDRRYRFERDAWIELSDSEETEEKLYEQSLEQMRRERTDKRQRELQYEDRIVAFLDVLGWRSAVERSERDDELARQLGMALHAILDQTKEIGWRQVQREIHAGKINAPVDVDIKTTQFSDSVVVSLSATQKEQMQPALVSSLFSVVTRLLELGFVVRGGIAAGKVIHNREMIYGPALNAAYDLEQTAIFPRIIVDERLASQWRDGYPLFDPFGQQAGMGRAWREAPDGKFFYDFLRPAVGDRFKRLTERQVRRLKDVVLAQLSKPLPRPIAEKYEWLAVYVNNVILEEGLSAIDPVRLTDSA